jgi:hypothetical protein
MRITADLYPHGGQVLHPDPEAPMGRHGHRHW